jgi:hypothetical protein
MARTYTHRNESDTATVKAARTIDLAGGPAYAVGIIYDNGREAWDMCLCAAEIRESISGYVHS